MNPLPRWVTWFAIALAFLLLGAVEETRIEGFRMGHVRVFGADFWIVNVDGWKSHALRSDAALAKVEAAQKQAKADQLAATKAVAESYRAQAEKADASYKFEMADVRAAADAYARSHGVRTVYRDTPGSPAASSVPDPSESGDGPGPDAVVLSRKDFDQLNKNTARLAQVHDWGRGLMDAGLAVPVDGR